MKKGIIKGSVLGTARILRCFEPFYTGGYDPPADTARVSAIPRYYHYFSNTRTKKMNIKRFPQDTFSSAAAEYITNSLKDLLDQKETLNLALAGGRAIGGVLSGLANSDIDWSRFHFFLADERCVPLEHPDSNYGQLNGIFFEKLVSRNKISEKNIHPYHYKPGIPDRGISEYEDEFRKQGGTFDFILLSMGEDGHTASLFPNHDWLKHDDRQYFHVTDSPKPPSERISITARSITSAGSVMLLVSGEAKRPSFQDFIEKSTPVTRCPSKIVLKNKSHRVLTDLDIIS